MQIKIDLRYHLTPVRMSTNKSDTKGWNGSRERGLLLTMEAQMNITIVDISLETFQKKKFKRTQLFRSWACTSSAPHPTKETSVLHVNHCSVNHSKEI